MSYLTFLSTYLTYLCTYLTLLFTYLTLLFTYLTLLFTYLTLLFTYLTLLVTYLTFLSNYLTYLSTRLQCRPLPQPRIPAGEQDRAAQYRGEVNECRQWFSFISSSLWCLHCDLHRWQCLDHRLGSLQGLLLSGQCSR